MIKLYKKIIIGAFILLFAFIFKINKIEAASCHISVSGPSSSVVGQSFKVSVTVPANSGSWEYVLSYDSSKVRQTSGPSKVVGVTGDSRTTSYTFTSLASGTTTFKVTNASIYDYTSEEECYSGANNLSVNMKTQAEVEESYSKNNNLSSLTIEGADLSPAFNKNTLEYSAKLPTNTTKAKVVATPEDSKSTIIGVGEIDVTDGLNKIEITVTAQHGEKKTYIINLTVEELKPIKVTINGKKYTVVRKSGMVENIPVSFVETKVKIKGEEVVAYKSDTAKITLVALKDEDGLVELFIYKNGKYTEFNEAISPEVNLLILDGNKQAPFGFLKTKFKYKSNEITGYKFFKSDKDYYLVYAKNLEDGKDNFYLYDSKNNTFQLFYKFPYEVLKYISLFTAIFTLLIIFIIIIKILKKLFTSKEKKINKYQKKILKLKNKLEEESYDIDDVDERPSIKKIENDEYVIPKKTRKERLKELEEAKKIVDNKKTKYKKMTLED